MDDVSAYHPRSAVCTASLVEIGRHFVLPLLKAINCVIYKNLKMCTCLVGDTRDIQPVKGILPFSLQVLFKSSYIKNIWAGREMANLVSLQYGHCLEMVFVLLCML